MGIAFFGGRFDPFHAGHIDIVRSVITLPEITTVHIVPSASPPHKGVIAPFSLRTWLIQYHLTKAGLPDVIVDPQEFARTGPSYTIDTVKSLELQYPNQPLYMVIGADTVPQLNTWHEITSLLTRVHLIIAKRPGFDFQMPEVALPPIILETNNNATATNVRTTHRAYQGYTIGITGRVGSGKSTAADHLSNTFGIRVVDLDKIGHALLKDEQMKRTLIETFSNSIIGIDGEIDRSTLGTLVFNNLIALQQLNQVIHPPLRSQAIKEIKSENTPCIVVGALLKELMLIEACDKVIVVDADPELIKAHIGEKFDRIQKTQRSQAEYKIDGTLITNTYDTRFYTVLTDIVGESLARF